MRLDIEVTDTKRVLYLIREARVVKYYECNRSLSRVAYLQIFFFRFRQKESEYFGVLREVLF